MIKYKLDERLDDVMDRTGKRPSFKDIADAFKDTDRAFGVSVLSNMRRKRGYVTTTRIIDALCEYFACQPGDLMEWRPDSGGKAEGTEGDD